MRRASGNPIFPNLADVLDIFIVVLASRLIVCLAIHWYSVTHGFEGFMPLQNSGDDRNYFAYATGITTNYGHAYAVFLEHLFSLSGPSILIGKIINSCAASISITIGAAASFALSGDLGYRESRKAMRRAALILSLYPAELFYTSQLLKDATILLSGNLIVYLAILIPEFRTILVRLILVVMAMASLFVLADFRPYAAAGIIAGVIAYWVYQLEARRENKIAGIALLLAVLAIAPIFLGLGFAANNLWAKTDLSSFEEFRSRNYGSQGSSLGLDLNPSHPAKFIPNYIYSMATFSLGPFPWQLVSASVIVSLPEAVAMWFLIPRFRKSIRKSWTQVKLPLTLPIFCSLSLIAITALIGDNIGTNTRLRMLPWNLAIVHLAARGWRKRAARRIILMPTQTKSYQPVMLEYAGSGLEREPA
jgi:hypothetical protein